MMQINTYKYSLHRLTGECSWAVWQSCSPCHFPVLPFTEKPQPFLCGWTFVYQNRYWNAHTSPTQEHTHSQPHAIRHWAWYFLPHTETYPVFMRACLFLKASLSHSKLTNQSRKAISGLSHSGTDACSQWEGKVVRFGELRLPEAAKCARWHSWVH